MDDGGVPFVLVAVMHQPSVMNLLRGLHFFCRICLKASSLAACLVAKQKETSWCW